MSPSFLKRHLGFDDLSWEGFIFVSWHGYIVTLSLFHLIIFLWRVLSLLGFIKFLFKHFQSILRFVIASFRRQEFDLQVWLSTLFWPLGQCTSTAEVTFVKSWHRAGYFVDAFWSKCVWTLLFEVSRLYFAGLQFFEFQLPALLKIHLLRL